MEKELRVIISGGGTGGHIFPAVSIANAVKALRPDAKSLFVGAPGRMEMQRVPAAGYEIKGLPIRGFFRPLWKPANIGVAIDYLRSKWLAKKILRDFKPQVAVGLAPVTGQPLPLISKGGTSTIINCAYVGAILSVSRSAKQRSDLREAQPRVVSAPDGENNITE